MWDPIGCLETSVRNYQYKSRNRDFLTLEDGTIDCVETSVRNYHYTLRNGDLLTLEDGADRLCRNVRKELPLYAA